MNSYIPREIDINATIEDVYSKQHDHLSRLLCVRIFDNNLTNGGMRMPLDLTDCEARLYVEGDNGSFYIDGDIIDERGGVIKFLFTNGITSNAGEYKCEIWLTNANENSVISTQPFSFTVDKSIRNHSEIEASDNFTALDKALLTVSSYDLKIQNVNLRVDETGKRIDEVNADILNKFAVMNDVLSKVAAYSSRLDSVDSRIDSILAISESEKNDLGNLGWEIADARRSVSKTYGTLGTAIRGQIRDVNASISEIKNEISDICIGEDGTEYETAGGAVRNQIRNLKNSVATDTEFWAEISVNYDDTDETVELISEISQMLNTAEVLNTRINTLESSIINYVANNSIEAEKLAPALKRPSTVIGSGTVAKMLSCAESYFNKAYTAPDESSMFIYESHAGLYSESLGKNSSSGQYSFVCSSFVDAILNAITFENSRYQTGNDINLKENWGVEFDNTGIFGTVYDGQTANDKQLLIDNRYLTSQNLARYAAEHGYLYAIDGSENVRAGDVLFSGNASDRYLGVGHVALVINTDGEYCTILESWPCEGESNKSSSYQYDINYYHPEACKLNSNKTVSSTGLRINYRQLISNYTYGATFPVGSVDSEFNLIETIYNKSGNTETVSLIHESDEVEQGFYTVVCHGSFDKTPHISIKYSDVGDGTSTYQSLMHKSGDNYYLTVYVQRTATILVRMTTRENDEYASDASTYNYDNVSILLYKGYAEMSSYANNSTLITNNVYGIGKAKKLMANDTLNSFECGVVYCSDGTTSLTVLGAPNTNIGSGFRCETTKMNDIGNGENGRYLQRLWYISEPGTMYIRMYNKDGWTNWFAFAGTEIT